MIYVSKENFIKYAERYIKIAEIGEIVYIVLDNGRELALLESVSNYM